MSCTQNWFWGILGMFVWLISLLWLWLASVNGFRKELLVLAIIIHKIIIDLRYSMYLEYDILKLINISKSIVLLFIDTLYFLLWIF